VPTYQYACTECGEQLEAVQSFSDPSLTECPACGGALRKVFSAVGVVFKGSGFYKTDSRGSGPNGDGAPKTESKTDTSTSKTESKTGSKTESKPETKSAASASSSTSSTTPTPAA
jgi:putative FmdB family regulatory protein